MQTIGEIDLVLAVGGQSIRKQLHSVFQLGLALQISYHFHTSGAAHLPGGWSASDNKTLPEPLIR